MGYLVRNQNPDKSDIGSGVGWSALNLSLCPWILGRFETGNQWGKLQDGTGGGNSKPFEESCWENPLDSGTWQAIQSMGLQRVGHD